MRRRRFPTRRSPFLSTLIYASFEPTTFTEGLDPGHFLEPLFFGQLIVLFKTPFFMILDYF